MRSARDLLKFNVKRMRERLGWKQPDLAAEAHLSNQMIQKIEQGKTAPSTETLDKLVRALGTHHAELFYDDTLSKEEPSTIADMTPVELEALITKASKRDGSINLEIERLKKRLSPQIKHSACTF